MYPLNLWFTKASILVFYYELFPLNPKPLRLALHLTTGFNVASFTVAVYMSVFFCRPISSNWYSPSFRHKSDFRSLNPETQCVNATNLSVFYSFAITNILCDIASNPPPTSFLSNPSPYASFLPLATHPHFNTPSILGVMLRFQSRRYHNRYLHRTHCGSCSLCQHNPSRSLECPRNRSWNNRRVLSGLEGAFPASWGFLLKSEIQKWS